MVYFSLSPHIYAAKFGSSIIVLDSRNDDYLSLIDDSARYLAKIVEQGFVFDQDNKLYLADNEDTQALNYWIEYYLEINFVYESNSPSSRPIAPNPIIAGGLHDYQWDSKPGWQPLKKARKCDLLKAFIQLARTHRQLKKYGIKGVLDAIQRPVTHNLIIPAPEEIQRLADTIDAASMLYPKKTFCLAWAATFVVLARKRCWDARLVIGVQAYPFYAHAWADINGKVIHDDPQIAQVLSLILKSPEGSSCHL